MTDYSGIKMISNEGGLLTIDFLFGIIISFIVMLMLLRVSFSLVITEVAQYVAFSVARAHAVGDVDLEAQRKSAKNKFNSLVQNNVLKNFFKDSFELATKGNFNENLLRSGDVNVKGVSGGGSFTQFLFDNVKDGSDFSGVPFVGVVIPLKLKWLNMNILFLGRTSEVDSSFKTNVTGFLIREPSQAECQDFMNKRYKQILERDDLQRFQHPSILQGRNSYVAMEDNGC